MFLKSKNPLLTRFYLFTLPPLFIFSFLIYFLFGQLTNAALFAFGFTFCLVPRTPNIESIIETKKYRFSFLRTCYLSVNYFSGLVTEKYRNLASVFIRILLPTFFVFTLTFIFRMPLSFYFCALGAIFCEVMMESLRRFVPRDILPLA